jgi:CBS domain-containing membrane protein
VEELEVRDFMTTDVLTLNVQETLSLAEEVMRMARVRHLPVVGAQLQVVGIVTHRDLLEAQASSIVGLSDREDKALKRTIAVRDVMTTEVVTIEPDLKAVEAARLLQINRFGCLPVVEGGALVGIVTEADFLDLLIRLLDRGQSGSTEQPYVPPQ